MKTGDVGALFARLGVNLDTASVNAATAELNRSFGGMSAGMKRSTREGAESLRLVGESLDLHMSRPLSKVIAQIPGLGTALAAMGGATVGIAGLFAVGSYLEEKLEPAISRVAKKYGLIGESAEEMGKRVTAENENIISTLKQAADMQDKYNRLVLNLQGAAYDDAHLKDLQRQTEEIQKQIAATLLQEDLAYQKPTWYNKLFNAASEMAELQHGNTSGNAAKWISGDTDAANKLDEAMQPLIKRFAELEDSIKETGWEKFRHGADEAAESAKKLQSILQEVSNLPMISRTHGLELPLPSGDPTGLLEAGRQLEKMQTTPKMPIYGGSKEAMDLWKVTNDQTAATAKLQEILTSIQTPQEKYNQEVKELNALKPQLTVEQYQLALHKLADDLEQAQKKVDKLDGGFKAFVDGLKVNSDTGKGIFDGLNAGLDGFENETIRILEGGRSEWHKFFDDLAAMAMKFAMQKSLSQLFASFMSPPGGSGPSLSTMWSATSMLSGALAGGGDVTPGSSYLVGENGPEIFSPSSAGTVFSNDSLRSGGTTVNNDFRGAVVSDDLMRKADAARMSAAIEGRLSSKIPALVNEQNLRHRS